MVEPLQLIIAGAAFLLLGFSKTGVPGLGVAVVPLLALVFPDNIKLGLGALLPMLMLGDVFAIAKYSRHTQWRSLFALLPAVAVGMVPGLLVLHVVKSDTLTPFIGGVILVLVSLEFARRRGVFKKIPEKWWFAVFMGLLAGFATGLANVAGPVMALYLLSRGYTKEKFIGTGAWFYGIVNALKLPVYLKDDMIIKRTLILDGIMLPVLIAGVFIGYKALPKISVTWFTRIILALTVLSAIKLLVS